MRNARVFDATLRIRSVRARLMLVWELRQMSTVTLLFVTDRVSTGSNAIASVHLSVRPSVSTQTFEPSDLLQVCESRRKLSWDWRLRSEVKVRHSIIVLVRNAVHGTSICNQWPFFSSLLCSLRHWNEMNHPYELIANGTSLIVELSKV